MLEEFIQGEGYLPFPVHTHSDLFLSLHHSDNSHIPKAKRQHSAITASPRPTLLLAGLQASRRLPPLARALTTDRLLASQLEPHFKTSNSSRPRGLTQGALTLAVSTQKRFGYHLAIEKQYRLSRSGGHLYEGLVSVSTDPLRLL